MDIGALPGSMVTELGFNGLLKLGARGGVIPEEGR